MSTEEKNLLHQIAAALQTIATELRLMRTRGYEPASPEDYKVKRDA
jgi:hypothetical protein